MDRSRRLWAAFLSLAVVFVVVRQGASGVQRAQLSATEDPFPPQALLIDDTDTERFVTEGDGWAKHGFPVGYRNTVWMRATGTEPAAAHWRFGSLPAGSYDAYATWVWGRSLPASLAYTVETGEALLLTATVDQRKGPAGPRWEGSMYPWQHLGTMALTENADVTVSLRGDAGDLFSADAVLLLPAQLSDALPALPAAPSWNIPVTAEDPSATDGTPATGFACEDGTCRIVPEGGMPFAQCQAACGPEDPAAPTADLPMGYRCEAGVCRQARGTNATLAQCEAACGDPGSLPQPSDAPARWVTVGPPHNASTSCAWECAARGGTCLENACTPFQTLWDGRIWSGGQKLKSTDALLFHNACDAEWGRLAPSLGNECCCKGVGADLRCGDGVVSPALGEECDDGNGKPGDGCSASCTREFCGDGVVSPALGEECDPALPDHPDGPTCSRQCRWEYCGDGTIQKHLGEECDDGNRLDGDGCQATCRLP